MHVSDDGVQRMPMFRLADSNFVVIMSLLLHASLTIADSIKPPVAECVDKLPQR